MTFKELEQELPNGFHDSQIRTIDMDFINRSVAIGLNLLMGGPDMPDPEEYRAGTLTIASVHLFFLDAPDPAYRFTPNGSPLTVMVRS
jgi:hypothetical protein